MKHGGMHYGKMSKRGGYGEGKGMVPSSGSSGCEALLASKKITNPMGNPGRVNSKERSKMYGKGY